MKGSNIPKSALVAYKASDEKEGNNEYLGNEVCGSGDGSRLVPKK